MKKADKRVIININGNNNKVEVGQQGKLSAIIITAIVTVLVCSIIVLVISSCRPELLPEFARNAISVFGAVFCG